MASRISRPVPVTVNDVLDGHVALDLECLDRLYLHGLDRPGDLGGSDPWEDAESCLHSGSIPMSCASAR
jgi:hypothetical protein